MASSLKQHFDDDLSCPVCLENFVENSIPKDLDCPHVCCLPCLTQMRSDIMGAIKCPQCQQITAIPTGGVAALRTNLRVRSLAEKLKEHRQANKDKMCVTHEDQEIFFYCKTCSTPICQYCIINDHSSHSVEAIKSIVREQKQKLGRALQKVQAQIEKCESSDAKLTENEELLVSQFTMAESKIDERIEAGLSEINSQGRDLKERLQRLRNNKLEMVRSQMKNTKDHLEGKRDVVNRAQRTLNHKSEAEYMTKHDRCFNELKTLIEDESTSWNSLHPVHSGFKLDIRSLSVNLGLNLMPEAFGSDSNNDVPSTSSEGNSQGQHQRKREADVGKQRPTSSTKRNKLDPDIVDVEDDDVCYVSLSESEGEEDFFDLTGDLIS